jgi:hypothetical protein
VLVTVALAVQACDDFVSGGPEAADVRGLISSVLVANIEPSEWPQDPFVLQEARIAGDTLFLQVAYGGGCRAHDFTLVISTQFMESEPVQTRALLAHDSHDDPCEAWLQSALRADLTPLKRAWQSAYHSPSGTVIVHLDVPVNEAECDATPFSEPGLCTLRYSF